jgi:hypothetical protein
MEELRKGLGHVVCPKKRAFASDINSADRLSCTAILKMSPEKPLKIPLFPMASGRVQVDELLGISIEQLTKQEGYSTQLNGRFLLLLQKEERKTPAHKLLHIGFICQYARSC